MDEQTYRQYPDALPMRELRVHVRGRRFRSRTITVATTLSDRRASSKAAVARLYRRRWEAELHLRSLKSVRHLDVLRCKSPSMVHKELRAHFLAYNLIRKVMAQAAQEFDRRPTSIIVLRARCKR
jgi:hypothetical protein